MGLRAGDWDTWPLRAYRFEPGLLSLRKKAPWARLLDPEVGGYWVVELLILREYVAGSENYS